MVRKPERDPLQFKPSTRLAATYDRPFLTRDPAKDGRNWYGYCGNSPVGNYDSDGHAAAVVPLVGGGGPTLVIVEGGAGGGPAVWPILVTAVGAWHLGRAIDEVFGISNGILEGLYPSSVGASLPIDAQWEIHKIEEAKKKKRHKPRKNLPTPEKGAEHTKNKRPSTEGKHQKGKARKKRDGRGGEKGDDRRPYMFILDDDEDDDKNRTH